MLKQIDRKGLSDIIDDEMNLIIYHHSNYWEEGEEILGRAKAKVIIRYHCITPPSFFEPYSDHCYLLCRDGRKQTDRIHKNREDFLWMAASLHNLVDAGISVGTHAVVVPPFHNLEQWKHVVPEEAILKSLMESPGINLLFVGRVCPHKGHRLMIEIVSDYVSYYGENISLHIIGKVDEEMHRYTDELDQLVGDYGLENCIVWIREVNDATLLSYYLGCDFYLNCSDHEGFCVPVVEAQSLCLPVICKRTSALPETAGMGQILLDDDVREYSAAIHILAEHDSYRDYLVRMGRENYLNRFSLSMIEKRFTEAVEDVTGVKL
jgi:glycosyltransferase involved in cell wall biosynthesis